MKTWGSIVRFALNLSIYLNFIICFGVKPTGDAGTYTTFLIEVLLALAFCGFLLLIDIKINNIMQEDNGKAKTIPIIICYIFVYSILTCIYVFFCKGLH